MEIQQTLQSKDISIVTLVITLSIFMGEFGPLLKTPVP